MGAQENPNYLELYRYGRTEADAYARSRLPFRCKRRQVHVSRTGHPEGYLEAFATIYVGVVEAIRRYIDGVPDGNRGV